MDSDEERELLMWPREPSDSELESPDDTWRPSGLDREDTLTAVEAEKETPDMCVRLPSTLRHVALSPLRRPGSNTPILEQVTTVVAITQSTKECETSLDLDASSTVSSTPKRSEDPFGADEDESPEERTLVVWRQKPWCAEGESDFELLDCEWTRVADPPRRPVASCKV